MVWGEGVFIFLATYLPNFSEWADSKHTINWARPSVQCTDGALLMGEQVTLKFKDTLSMHAA